MNRHPKVVKHQSNPGYDIICEQDDNSKVSVKMITAENKYGSTSKIKHEWNELIGIELGENLEVIKLGIITRDNFEEELKKRKRILEPSFGRAMLKENGLFNDAGKLYNQQELEIFNFLK
jgi:hypothetical protein